MRRLGIVLGNTLAAIIFVIILTQDLQIYAELLRQSHYDPPGPTVRAADAFVIAVDGQRIHFRRWEATASPQTALRTAILSHGNAGTMDDYVTIPAWLASLGVTTYVYDYRGYGLSSGWPSERGLYQDAEAIWRYATVRDDAIPRQTLVFGHSLGGGPATFLAEKYGMAALLLAASYTSIPERAALHPFFGFLAPFVWTEFPNRTRISNLRESCLMVLHGEKDETMPITMSRQLQEAYRGSNRALLATHPEAGHADIIKHVPALARPLLSQCRFSP